MPPLDIPTLLVVLGALVAMAGLVLILLWRENPQEPGLRTLASSFFVGSAAGGLAASYGSLPAIISIQLADLTLTLCFAGMTEGFRRFFGAVPRSGWVFAAAGIALAASTWWTWVSPNVQMRSIFSALLLLAFGAAMAAILWSYSERKTRIGSALLITGALLFSVLMLTQVVHLLRTPVEGFASTSLLLVGLVACLFMTSFGIVMVVAERHLATTEELRRQAEQGEHTKMAFLAVMSHEIRTPMNGVLGLTELLLGTSLEQKQRQLALSIRSSGRILLRILDDVLDLSKIEAGRLELETVRFNMRDLLEEICQLVEQAAERKGLILRLQIDDDVPSSVSGDPNRLGQVLLNLLGNAVKFTEEGRIDLRVTTGDNDLVFFEVEDTGIGLTPESLKRIFSDFEQSEASTSRRYGGTGLGLSICQKLADLMGGYIEVDSVFGQGSIFRLCLFLPPAIESVPETEDISLRKLLLDELGARPSSSSSPRSSVQDGPRVLVVDDDPVSQLVTSGLLESLNVVCDIAFNGEEALTLLGRERYDLVFMDCHMPKLNGLEATRRWRAGENNGRLPIIALTAGVLADEKQQCFDVGMDDVVTKPVSSETLVGVLERWLPGAPS